ncbi:TPA: hypothetical protein ACHU7H_002046, partial [Streptococcus suis]
MKTRTKWLIGAAVLGLAVGGYTMKEQVFGFGEVPVSQTKELTREEKQLAYLKEHEQEIIDFVKSQNPKIESVQIDWDETFWGKGGGMFETTYYIRVFGQFNNMENSSWGVQVFYDNESGEIDMNSLG